MNWFSDEHREIYSRAFTALKKDVTTVGNSLVSTTNYYLTDGYNRVKNKIRDYQVTGEPNNSFGDDPNVSNPYYNSRGDNQNNKNDDVTIGEVNWIGKKQTDEKDQEESISDETDDSVVRMGQIYPDVLVELHKELKHIKRLYVVDEYSNKRLVKGKISSYDYINRIVHGWFSYENRDKKYKWYPTEKLYTSYRQSSPRILTPLDNVMFRYGEDGYKPYRYHPLL